MRVRIGPGGRLAGTVRVPGDKSIAHRWLLLAASHRT
jgi:5-enolpyruvylshikimate-3-phosphate synthase